MKQITSVDFLRGNTDLMLLSVLDDGAKYGYLIQQRIAEVSNGRVELKAGTLYPLLHRLEADKLVKSRIDDSTGRKRKWYQLTAAGKKRLKHQAKEWSIYAECMRQLLVPYLNPSPA